VKRGGKKGTAGKKKDLLDGSRKKESCSLRGKRLPSKGKKKSHG